MFTISTAYGAGIVRRQGKVRYPLQIPYWLKRGVKVKPSFGFKDTTTTTISHRFGLNFLQSLHQAMAHNA